MCPFQMAPCPFENLGRTLLLVLRHNTAVTLAFNIDLPNSQINDRPTSCGTILATRSSESATALSSKISFRCSSPHSLFTYLGCVKIQAHSKLKKQDFMASFLPHLLQISYLLFQHVLPAGVFSFLSRQGQAQVFNLKHTIGDTPQHTKLYTLYVFFLKRLIQFFFDTSQNFMSEFDLCSQRHKETNSP